MAYILGFFAADGCLTINRKRNNRYIEFVSTDKEIIEKIKSLKFPVVPSNYLPHFIRGYFDRDGHCTFGKYQRKNRPSKTKIIRSGFTSGSQGFLEKLQEILKEYAKTEGGILSFHGGAYRLLYSLINSQKLYNYLYSNIDQSLYLSRKYIKFNQALKMWGRSSVG